MWAYRYVQQGLRAVNQAMGRVIRHRWDYGAVLLADERFGTQQNLRNMSKWLRDQVVQHNSFGGAIASLTRFFKVMGLTELMTGSGMQRLGLHGKGVSCRGGCFLGCSCWPQPMVPSSHHTATFALMLSLSLHDKGDLSAAAAAAIANRAPASRGFRAAHTSAVHACNSCMCIMCACHA